MYGALNTMTIERRVFAADFNFAEDRRSYSSEFKAQVALEALRNDKSHIDIALQYAIHPYQVNLWKQHLLNNVTQVFEINGPYYIVFLRHTNTTTPKSGK
ncbi:MAG: transposase [Gammaproteobacteria bacterium]|nr:transposase [Gammaproteobacteria bacterium]